jgi:hypothetical protein
LGRLTSRQVSEWIAWARVRGMPQARDDFRAGQICAVLANIHRDDKARPEPFGPADFMPGLVERQEGDEQPETEEIDLEEVTRQLERMLGKRETKE